MVFNSSPLLPLLTNIRPSMQTSRWMVCLRSLVCSAWGVLFSENADEQMDGVSDFLVCSAWCVLFSENADEQMDGVSEFSLSAVHDVCYFPRTQTSRWMVCLSSLVCSAWCVLFSENADEQMDGVSEFLVCSEWCEWFPVCFLLSMWKSASCERPEAEFMSVQFRWGFWA
jgi:hypothetical protein